jgi:sulfonate transport system substrate-binding protein
MKISWAIFFTILIGSALITETKADSKTIRFCRLKAPLAFHAYVAEEKKYFSKRGLAVEFQPVPQAKICLDAIAAGRVDAFIAAESVMNFADPVSANFSIAARTIRGPFDSLVTNKFSSVYELKGKRIGILPATASQLFILHLLKDTHQSFRDLSFVVLQPPSWSSALVGNMIDGASAFEPFATQAFKALGERANRIEGKYQPDGLLVISKQFIEKRRAEALKMLEAFIEAEHFITTNFDEAVAIVSQATSDPLERIRTLKKQFLYKVALDGSTLSLMQRNAVLLDEIAPSTEEKKALYNYKSLFDQTLLSEIERRRVIGF